MKRLILAGLACVLLGTGSAMPMAVVTNATGPYNYGCAVFTEHNQRDKVAALAFAQGYFAALNLQRENKIDLQSRWQELNAYVIRYCTDKTNPYLWRRLVNDAVDDAFTHMTSSADASDNTPHFMFDGIHRVTCSGPLRGDGGDYNRVGYCETSSTYPDVNKVLLKGCRYYHSCSIDARVLIPEGPGNAIIMHVFSVHPGK